MNAYTVTEQQPVNHASSWVASTVTNVCGIQVNPKQGQRIRGSYCNAADALSVVSQPAGGFMFDHRKKVKKNEAPVKSGKSDAFFF